MTTGDPATALNDAKQALVLRQASPTEAKDLAIAVLQRSDLDDDARTTALWALGLACRELNELESAEQHLTDAIELAVARDDLGRSAAVRSGLVAVLVARGRALEALRLADEIRSELDEQDLAELDMKRALALEDLGRVDEALRAYSDALEIIAAGKDRLLEARLRCNRGIVHAFQGDNAAALHDSLIAERIAREEGQLLLAGGAANNAGFVHGRLGNIVDALDAFTRADELYAAVGYPGRCSGVLAADRCQVLLTAGLGDEARASAELAVSELEKVDDVIDLAEAQLLLARACLAQHDHAAAQHAAQYAAFNFRAAGRAGWAVLADFLELSARHGAGDVETAPNRIAAMVRVAGELEHFGWTAEAISVRVTVAQMALDLDDRSAAEQQLLRAASARHAGSADRRSHAWLATAMLRRSIGDRGGARRALTAGLRVLADHQASLGATDLRVGAAAHATGLADLGVDMALEDRRPAEVLKWSERRRASALAIPSARAPVDGTLATAMADLRRMRSDLDAARTNGSASPTDESTIARQERTVRDAARLLHGGDHVTGVLDLGALRSGLGDRTLVEYIQHGERLVAVTVTPSRCHLHEIGPIREVATVLDAALFALRRLARQGASDASLAAAVDALLDALGQLERLLIAPLRLGGNSIVIVPTGALHGVPWSGLPALLEREVVVTPSASRWLASPTTTLGSARATIIAGPALVHAEREVAAVAALYPGASVLTGRGASVEHCLTSLEGVGIAHVACHGSLRSDSPMFSALQMHDGPMTVYDLEQLVSPPNIVVLPACNAGTADVSTGDELIGTTAALLGIGVRTVIAPITEVNDEAVVGLMIELHTSLINGATPAHALASVRRSAVGSADPARIGAALTLLCSS